MQTTSPAAPSAAATSADRYRANVLTACERALVHLEKCARDVRKQIDQAKAAPSDLSELPGEMMKALAWCTANAATELSRAPRWLVGLGAAEEALRATPAGDTQTP